MSLSNVKLHRIIGNVELSSGGLLKIEFGLVCPSMTGNVKLLSMTGNLEALDLLSMTGDLELLYVY